MKKTLFLLIFLSSSARVFSCDACSCSAASSLYFGILPRFTSHILGINHSVKQYSTHYKGHPLTRQQIQSTELWFRYNVGNKIQLYALLPYHQINSSHEESSLSVKGLGEGSLLLKYMLVRTADSSNSALKHTLLAGIGTKLATADPSAVKRAEESLLTIPSLGTGSISYLFSLNYSARYRNWTFNLESSYTYNTMNTHKHLYGDRSSTSLQLMHWIALSRSRALLLPSFGLQYEYMSSEYSNYQTGSKVENSKGNISWARAGLDLYFNKIALGAYIQAPIQQNIAGTQVKAQEQLGLHLLWFLSNTSGACK